MQKLLRHLPNALTILRLLLALPLGWLILNERYAEALIVGFIAGLSDALDGAAARQLEAFSRLGAILDPIADKLLITVCMLSFALASLIPWWLALLVVGRDLVIISGALCYHAFIGSVDMEPTRLSKATMFVQVTFCVLVLASQLFPALQAVLHLGSYGLVAAVAIASGLHYVWLWSHKAMQARRAEQSAP